MLLLCDICIAALATDKSSFATWRITEAPTEVPTFKAENVQEVERAVRSALCISAASPLTRPLLFYEPIAGEWQPLQHVNQLPQRENLPVKLRCGEPHRCRRERLTCVHCALLVDHG